MENNQSDNVPSDWKEQIRQSMIIALTGNEQEKKEMHEKLGYAYLYYAPSSLYKYFPPKMEKIELLQNMKMWYSTPNRYNDAFDCDFSIDKEGLFDSIIKALAAEYPIRVGSPAWLNARTIASKAIEDFKSELSIIRETTGVTCFSENDDSLLMWAHYAYNHQGMCVEYNLLEFSKELLFSPVPIIYTNQRPSLSKIERQNFEKDIMSVFIKSITTKANEWEYEKEWRIIRDKGACGSAWAGDGKGAELPSIKPKSVILGCEAQVEFELRVRAYCEDCRVDLYKMEKDDKEYRLNKKQVLHFSS